MRYEIVSSQYADHLPDKVTEALQAGAQLAGSLLMDEEGFCQAVLWPDAPKDDFEDIPDAPARSENLERMQARCDDILRVDMLLVRHAGGEVLLPDDELGRLGADGGLTSRYDPDRKGYVLTVTD